MKRLLFTLFLILFSVSQADATSYWTSTGAASTTLTDCDGDADPGVYCTMASILSGMATGDKLIGKAGTYGVQLVDAIKSGLNTSQRTTFDCETTADPPNGVAPVCINAPTGTGIEVLKFTSNRSNILIQNWKFSAVNITSPPAIIRRTAGATFTDINFYNMEIDGTGATFSDTGSLVNTRSMTMTMRNSNVHTCATADHQPGCHAFYVWANNNVIENNVIHDVDGLGITYYESSGTVAFSGGIIRFNRIYNTTKSGILYGGASSNGTGGSIYGNVVYDSGSTGIDCFASGCSVYNNTSYSNTSTGILCDGYCNAASTIRNNISIGNGTNCTLATSVNSNNLCSGTDTVEFIDPTTAGAGKNLNLKEGSNAIGGGVLTGLPSGYTCVATGGTVCDQGAYQAPVRSSAVVEDADKNTYIITLSLATQSVRSNVGLKSCTVANFALRDDGAGKTESACTVSGTSKLNIDVSDGDFTAGVIDDAYTRDTLTDNVNIGGTYAAVRTWSATAGTNNVGGGALPALTQSRFRFHHLRGTEAAPTLICTTCTENVNMELPRGAAFRLRVKFRTDDDPAGTTYKLRVSKDGGAYGDIPDVMGTEYIAWYGVTGSSDIPAAGTPTTELLTSDEASNTACAVVRSSSDFPIVDLNNSEAECEYALQTSMSAPLATTWDFRLYRGDNTPLDVYTVTPRLTAGVYVMGF